MGLASKLQAGGAGGMMPPPMAGGGALPYPGAAPSAPPAPYTGQQPQPGMPSPYPSAPYPGSGPAAGGPPGPQAPYGQPQQQQQTPYGQPPQQQQQAGAPSPYPAAYPSPYPGAPGTPPAGGMLPPGPQQQQQQQRPPYPMPAGAPGAAPGAMPPYPGAPPGAVPPQQQQQQPMVPGAAPGGAAAPGGMAGSILTKLNSIVAANQLQRFYSPQALQALAQKLDGRVNFRDLAARWRMPVELSLDLASLALYDIILFADDSGSMAFEENGERIDDLKLIASKVAEVATLFDDDGILMRFMNSPTEGNAIRSPTDVGALLGAVQYSGLTPLATALQSKVLQPIVFNLAATGQLAKPVLIISITDGEPTDNPKDLVVQVIKDSRNRLAAQYGPKAVAFEFAQVGKDSRAQAFLSRLDMDKEVGGSIDCTSYYEMESAEYQRRGIQLSPEMWLVKMMVGSIDPSYDEGDE